MKPIKFPEQNVVFAKNQPPYLPLPAYHDKEKGVITHCWQFSEDELKKIIQTGKLWIQVSTFNNPPQPILPMVDNPFKDVKSKVTINPKEDKRIVYAVGCTWWDDIHKVSSNTLGLPCCPFCESILLEIDSIETWNKQIKKYADKKNEPDYINFIAWSRGKCWKTHKIAREAYHKDKEKEKTNGKS